MKYFTVFITTVLLTAAHAFSAAQNPSGYQAKAELDSTVIIMGSKSRLHVEFSGRFDANSRISTDENAWKDVELSADNEDIVKELGNNRRQITRDYIVQAFDSGVYSLPRFYIVNSDAETIRTNSPVLKVDPISLDSANVVFKDGKPQGLKIDESSVNVVDEDYHFFDFLPDWVTNYWPFVLIVVIAIALIGYIYFKWLRHGKLPLVAPKKPTPPYQLAVEQLRLLQDRQLWQKGAEKEYYTQLTDILRTYIQGRFGINAMEMTSDQIVMAIRKDVVTDVDAQMLDKILTQADFVKFAKARPLAPENEQAFTMAASFVEDTKPIEVDSTAESESQEPLIDKESDNKEIE